MFGTKLIKVDNSMSRHLPSLAAAPSFSAIMQFQHMWGKEGGHCNQQEKEKPLSCGVLELALNWLRGLISS